MIIRFWGREFFVPSWVKFLVIIFVLVGLLLAGYLIVENRGSGVVSEVYPTVDSLSTALLQETPQVTAKQETPQITQSPAPTIFVYIVGEIVNSDVYEIPENFILKDLVNTAGGFTENADTTAINLASKLTNGMMIKIPAKDSSDKTWIVDNGTSNSSSSSSAESKKVNINTATVSELTTLPGIGESTALKIISYRTENGPFSKIQDITNISGIKNARYNEIKDYITVD